MDLEKIGLKLHLDFISEQEEAEIIENIKNKPNSNRKNTTGRNEIRRYGSSVPYQNCMISNQIPDFLQNISKKILDQGLLEKLPDSVAINEYYPGQGIDPHIDNKKSGKVITILALGSHTFINFHKQKEETSVFFPPRCLLQMRDEIRDKWKHSISPVAYDLINEEKIFRKIRYSIVFRCSDKYGK